MHNILTLARVEARRIFVSPLVWAVLAVIQAILGVFFILYLNAYAQTMQMSNNPYLGVSMYIGGGLYSTAVIVLLLVIPLMTMRLFAEERKSGSLSLLFASPTSLIEIVLGKYLGLLSFFLAEIVLLGGMSLTLCAGTDLDLGRIAAGLLGLFLMMMAFGAAGLFVSTLTREPVIAAITSFGLLLFLWILQAVSQMPGLPFAGVLRYLSMIEHFQDLKRGLVSTTDIIYYLLFVAFFLWMAVLRLDIERN